MNSKLLCINMSDTAINILNKSETYLLETALDIQD